MQDKESEALRNQRRRRKRIGLIKNAIIAIISGWILISIILIIILFVRMTLLEHKLNNLQSVSSQTQDTSLQLGSNTVNGETVTPDAENDSEALHNGDAVQTVSSDINEDNLAEEGDAHQVYLTFDNGPSENTAAILDILAEYNVKATFFVSGKEDEESEELYRRIVDEGHTLGMHSYSNKYNVIYQSQEAFEEDFQKQYQYLYKVTGQKCKYYRFLGGSSNQISNVPMGDLIQYLNQQNTVYFDWNVSAGDEASSAYTSEEIVENVMQDVVKYKTSVVLLHDAEEQSATVAAMGPLIEALQNIDAEILPIDEDTPVIQYVKVASVE